MRKVRRFFMIWVAGIAAALAAAPESQNTTTVVLDSGPLAGSYTIDNNGCIELKERDKFGVTFKKFAHSPTVITLEEAAMELDRASTAGAKTGDVVVKLLAVGSDKAQDYSVSNVTLSVTRVGAGARLSFDGRTKEGLHMRVTATCDHTEAY